MKKDNSSLEEEIRLHVAGATVRHKGRFHELPSYSNKENITLDFINKWTNPFYMKLHKTDEEWVNFIISVKPEITDEVILTNLGDFNWRTRQTGAYFAAIKDRKEFTEIIGTHLVKSEVCFAGRVYARVLASFNTEEAISYLEKYLDYYLLRKELEFDQTIVMETLAYLDKVNGTNRIARHLDNWRYFLHDRIEAEQKRLEKLKSENGDPAMIKHLEKYQRWSEMIKTDWIEEQIQTIEKIKSA